MPSLNIFRQPLPYPHQPSLGARPLPLQTAFQPTIVWSVSGVDTFGGKINSTMTRPKGTVYRVLRVSYPRL